MPANGIGVIDNKYCGDNDEWIMPVVNFSKEIQHIKKGERICQFKIVKQQPLYDIRIVDMLNNPDRKGLGSTGRE
jgi:dUTP pyrophosphatase